MGTKANSEVQNEQQINGVKGVDAQEFEEFNAKAKSTRDAFKENVQTVAALNALIKSDVWKIDKRRNKDWTSVEVTKDDVINVVNNLWEPYHTEISNFIKQKDIEWMQRYLNEKIRGWDIDKAELENFLKSKRISFNGEILEDWKFGPQTLYTMKFIIKKQKEDKKDKDNGKDKDDSNHNHNDNKDDNHNDVRTWDNNNIIIINPPSDREDKKDKEDKEDKEDKKDKKEKNKEEKEKLPNLDWIKKEMGNMIDGLRNGKTDKNWYEERHDANWRDMFSINTKDKIISLTTRGTKIEGWVESRVDNNRCELDWKTWKIYVFCWNYKYEMPQKTQKLVLDEQWNPVENAENKQKIRAFTEVWNLMNMLKANYIFNWWDYSFEESGWDIEYNNGEISNLRFQDTEIVSSEAFDRINSKYFGTWIRFDKTERKEMACLLNAMKLDQQKLTLDELEDGCTDDDVELSKKLSHTYRGN